ncbi:MAG: DUF58 domain-containing protein [Oscillospiraceae bacterium]|jgi:uncharacterized protein (DUF58 family)|nr:DUF58 domain-containing protein [Oscillospiraceae bacterium]
MKKRLIIIAGLFIVALIRIMYSGESFLLWIMLLIAAVFVLSLINVAYTILFIKISQTVIPEELTGEEYGTLVINIQNRGFLPLAHLDVWYDTFDTLIGGSESGCVAFSVLPGQTVGVRRQIYFPYRGLYRPGIIKVEVYDIFGLLKFNLPVSVYKEKQTVTILPKTISPLFDIGGENSFVGGGTDGREEQDPHSIAEIREFRQGDPLKRVHWKLTARMGELQIKEFDGAVSPNVRFFVDLSPHGLTGEEAIAFENCVCVNAATICKSALVSVTPLRMIAFSGGRAEISGISPPDLIQFLRFLAEARFNSPYRFVDILRSELESGFESGNIIIITGEHNSELSALTASLAIRGLNVSLIAVSKTVSYEVQKPPEYDAGQRAAGVITVAAVPEILRPPVTESTDTRISNREEASSRA